MGLLFTPRRVLGSLTLAGCLFVGQPVRADAPASPVGVYHDDSVTIQLAESNGAYTGTITRGNTQFPAKATLNGQTLTGTFVVGNDTFPFTATLGADGKMTFTSGGKTRVLSRVVANPLASHAQPEAQPQPAAPAPADASAAPLFPENQSFARFSVLGSTPTGRTLFLQLPGASTLEASLTQTADELGKILDAKPVLANAFADSKGKSKGGVSFTGKVKGRDVKGMILAGADMKGANATVVFAAANAPKEDQETLFAAVPALPKMTTHSFPDGSGSVDLPDGWTTPNPSAAHGFSVLGPQGQLVVFNTSLPINEPDCSLVRNGKQLYQLQLNNYHFAVNRYNQLLAMHQRNPNFQVPQQPQPPVEPNPDPNIQYPGLLFCRQCDGPEEVLKYYYPMETEKAKNLGKPYMTVDKVFAVVDGAPNPFMPGSKSGVVYMATTNHNGDKEGHGRVVVNITTSPVMAGQSWMLTVTIMAAPDAVFDRDLPVMNAVVQSVKLDMKVVTEIHQGETDAIIKTGQENIERIRKNGEAFRDSQARTFAAHEQQIAAQEKARHDSASDFIEYIGGVRHVVDTRTGQRLDVDLFNSNAITDGLNAAANDPTRFVQVPLRYER